MVGQWLLLEPTWVSAGVRSPARWQCDKQGGPRGWKTHLDESVCLSLQLQSFIACRSDHRASVHRCAHTHTPEMQFTLPTTPPWKGKGPPRGRPNWPLPGDLRPHAVRRGLTERPSRPLSNAHAALEQVELPAASMLGKHAQRVAGAAGSRRRP